MVHTILTKISRCAAHSFTHTHAVDSFYIVKPLALNLQSSRSKVAAQGSIQIRLGFIRAPTSHPMDSFDDMYTSIIQNKSDSAPTILSAPPVSNTHSLCPLFIIAMHRLAVSEPYALEKPFQRKTSLNSKTMGSAPKATPFSMNQTSSPGHLASFPPLNTHP